ncbi:hypothetical protein ACOMHN_026902 [Nucella lapillus]
MSQRTLLVLCMLFALCLQQMQMTSAAWFGRWTRRGIRIRLVRRYILRQKCSQWQRSSVRNLPSYCHVWPRN